MLDVLHGFLSSAAQTEFVPAYALFPKEVLELSVRRTHSVRQHQIPQLAAHARDVGVKP